MIALVNQHKTAQIIEDCPATSIWNVVPNQAIDWQYPFHANFVSIPGFLILFRHCQFWSYCSIVDRYMFSKTNKKFSFYFSCNCGLWLESERTLPTICKSEIVWAKNIKLLKLHFDQLNFWFGLNLTQETSSL